jgi:hypothetical protein
MQFHNYEGTLKIQATEEASQLDLVQEQAINETKKRKRESQRERERERETFEDER